VILETGSLVHQNQTSGAWESAFDATEWQTLWNYEAQFKARQVTWYTYPFGTSDNFNYGLTSDPGYADTQIAPLEASLTSQGKALFDYLNPNSAITFKSAWVYLPRITDTSGNTIPLLSTSSNEVIASTHKYADGRENLAVTADNAWFLTHSQLLSYGLVNWATRGIFLGERHVNVDVQVDDASAKSERARAIDAALAALQTHLSGSWDSIDDCESAALTRWLESSRFLVAPNLDLDETTAVSEAVQS